MAKFINLSFFILASLVALSSQDCPPFGIIIKPHEDCTMFYVCDNGHEEVLLCPDYLYFNPQIEACDFPANVPECVGGTRPTEQPSEPTSAPTETTTSITTTVPTSTTTEDITTTTPPTSTIPPSTTTPPPSTSTQGPPPQLLTECGETSYGNSGRIQYRLNQTYDADELCSFTLHVPDFFQVQFTLNSHGINESEVDPLHIFTFSREGHEATALLGPPSSVNQVTVNGSLIVVVFQTKRSFGHGFDLSYEGIGSQSYYLQGEHFAFNAIPDVSGSLQIPTQNETAARGTLNAFVISQNYKMVQPSNYMLRLEITNSHLNLCGGSMACGCESIRVFTFTGLQLNEESVFCDPDYHRFRFATTGMYIVIFEIFWDPYPRRATLEWLSESM